LARQKHAPDNAAQGIRNLVGHLVFSHENLIHCLASTIAIE
jgi:hypothetical protein